jgi:hypothetical protein
MPAAMIATSKMMCLTRPSIQSPQYAPESRDVINPAACRDRQDCPRRPRRAMVWLNFISRQKSPSFS